MFARYRVFAALIGLTILGASAFAQFDTGGGYVPKPAWESFKLNPKTRIKLDFKNANVDLVISFISKTSKVTIVKDPNLTGPITVTSAGSVPLKEAFEILKSVLSMKGYDIQKEGNHLVVRQRAGGGRGGRGGTTTPGFDPNNPTGMPAGFDWGSMGQNSSELKVYPIEFASATQVARVINDVFSGVQDPMQQMFMQMGGPMAMMMGNRGGRRGGTSRFGGSGTSGGAVRASADDYSNSVIVNASSKDQEEVAGLIKKIDKQTDDPMRSQVFPLEYAVAGDLATVIQNVLTSNAPKGRGGASSTSIPMEQRFMAAMRMGSSSAAFGNVVAEPRTNSLVVTATDENLILVGQVIKELDKEVKFEPTTFVFPLANARADLLAQLLTQAFGARSGAGTGGNRGYGTSTSGNIQNRTGNRNNRTNSNSNRRTSGGSGMGRSSDNTGDQAFDQNELELALQDPGSDSGELQTQIFTQGFGGMGRNTNQQPTRGTDAQGRLVNVRDLTGQVTIIADPNTNSLIVVTLPENAELIRQILAQLDRIPEQVMIETIIVEATLDASSKMGVEWKFTEKNLAGDTGNTGTFEQNYGMTSTTPPPTGFKFTMTGGNLSAFMNLLKTDSKFQVLSTPRIFTANNSEAEINISQSIPYVLSQREDANGNLTFNYAFQDVGIVLTVTPRITADGYVSMDVTQTANDLQGYTTFNAPIVNQRQATTSVSVKDGETIILGGIIRNTVTATTNKIPLLGDIPLLGNLFKSTSKENHKTELLVFLTPRVVRDPAEAKKLMEDQKNKLSKETQKTLKDAIPPPTQGTDQGADKSKGGS